MFSENVCKVLFALADTIGKPGNIPVKLKGETEKELNMNYDSGIRYDDPAVFYDSAPYITLEVKVSKIKLAKSHLPVPNKIVKYNFVGTKMTGNQVFLTLQTDVTAYKLTVAALETAQEDYDSHVRMTKQLEQVRNDKLALADAAYLGLANGAEKITTNAAELESGGWEVIKKSTPIGPLPAPKNLKANGAKLEGTVDLLWQVVRGRDLYEAQMSTTAEGVYTQCYIGSRAKCTVENLESGKLYYFKVRAKGAAGFSPFSDICSKRAA